MLTTITPYSYVEQDFIWIGEYVDGTHLAEFNFQTKEQENYYSIKRDILLRFGLIGHGMKLYYEVGGGFFKLNGQMYELVYRVRDKEYYLTGQSKMYNDTITYKDAESWADLSRQERENTNSRIISYNFGYKEKLDIDGVRFSVKAICSVPFNNPINFQIGIVASEDLEGQLVFKKNGTEVAMFDAPLKKGVGGKLEWTVR